jgi:3-hydroxy-9,10-secoandrosta-1,3,5(10)-triene-9,17-dione monooxygenase reductase component
MEEDFKSAMRQWRSGLCLVSANVDNQLVGLVCNSFTSVSLDPPLILWCVDHHSTSISLWRRAGSYALHFLPDREHPLFKRFTQKGGDKFSGLSHATNEHGDPIFPELSTRFDCELFRRQSSGDHDLMIGRPTTVIHPLSKVDLCHVP